MNQEAVRATIEDRGAVRSPWAALAVLLLPVLLVSIDNTVLAFALPQISLALEPGATQVLWMVDVYPLVLAGLLVPMGALADRYGRRRMLLLGSVGFAAMSVVAAYAPTGEALVAARAGLGVFGAMLMPSTLSLIRALFTDRAQRRTAIAVWAAGFASGSALGPIVGGFLLAQFWWGSVFLMAVPVLVLFLALAPFVLPESRDPHGHPLDLWSAGLVLVSMLAIVYGIKTVAKGGVTGWGSTALVVGSVVIVVFVRRQLRLAHPMIDVRLFATGPFSGAVLVNLLSVFSLIGFLFFVSQQLQLVHGFAPMRAGLMLLPGVLAMILAGLAVVPLVKRVRPVVVVCVALAASGAGYLVMALSAAGGSTTVGVGTIVVAFVLLAAGVGAAETVSNDLIVSAVPEARAGAASAISETAYEVGTVLGTAILGTILTTTYSDRLRVPDGLSVAQAGAARETLAGAVQVTGELPAGMADALMVAAQHAFGSGVAITSLIGVGLSAASVPLAALTLRRAR
ncbi:MFS transporter [Nocardioides nitrophenolicus]|uniref:MFS transporter n=1 Tax=Nocardioides nitrophenolicus TaxID=60489 RepID=UPI00195D0057|nr:MFS transporter [Nocardioides nitrophenolicus]MBM7518719.1 DHA2 family multidrug resistance protein-like MFS transporter [Nocardioides nitrophenolicus]